jgi:hypothetical protein
MALSATKYGPEYHQQWREAHKDDINARRRVARAAARAAEVPTPEVRAARNLAAKQRYALAHRDELNARKRAKRHAVAALVPSKPAAIVSGPASQGSRSRKDRRAGSPGAPNICECHLVREMHPGRDRCRHPK